MPLIKCVNVVADWNGVTDELFYGIFQKGREPISYYENVVCIFAMDFNFFFNSVLLLFIFQFGEQTNINIFRVN